MKKIRYLLVAFGYVSFAVVGCPCTGKIEANKPLFFKNEAYQQDEMLAQKIVEVHKLYTLPQRV